MHSIYLWYLILMHVCNCMTYLFMMLVYVWCIHPWSSILDPYACMCDACQKWGRTGGQVESWNLGLGFVQSFPHNLFPNREMLVTLSRTLLMMNKHVCKDNVTWLHRKGQFSVRAKSLWVTIRQRCVQNQRDTQHWQVQSTTTTWNCSLSSSTPRLWPLLDWI